MNRQLREAFRFHSKHGGGIVGQQAAGALRAARAELRLQQEIDGGKARIRWEPDDVDPADVLYFEADIEAVRSGKWSLECCILQRRCRECGAWRTVASLCGITLCDPDPYRRMVEAELAMEAFD